MRGPVMRAVSGGAIRGLNLGGKDSNLGGKFRFGYEIGKFTVNSEIGAQDSGCVIHHGFTRPRQRSNLYS